MKKRMRSSKGIAMGVRPMANALVLIVEPHDDDDEQYVARFVENNEPLISYIPAVMLNGNVPVDVELEGAALLALSR